MLGFARVLSPVRLVTLVAAGVIALYICALATLFHNDPGWLIDKSGHPRTNEYVGVRAAGVVALRGKAADAYDWTLHRAAEAEIIGGSVKNYFAWPYPPLYLPVAMALASLPFLPSALLWIAVTLAVYAWSVIRITGVRAAGLWAVASPPCLINAYVAHTGFWTAGAMGLALEALETRPVVAGVLFGAMTMKPQLGLLIPVALMAGGYWRVMGSAVAATLCAALVSIAAFGFDPWLQMMPQMARISDEVRNGNVNMDLLVSLYGCLRSLGASHASALAAQSVLSVVLVVGVFKLWRSDAPLALKAAGLASASLLVSPYMFVYDLTHLSIAIAFLIRHCGLAGLTRVEAVTIVASMVMMLALAILPLPLGFLANAHVGAIIVARVWPYLQPTRLRANDSVVTAQV